MTNEVLSCIRARRSCKKYAAKQISEEELQAVLEAGTWAASGMDRQAAKIIVLQKPEDVAAAEKLNAKALGNPDAKPFYGAPTVCLVLADASASTGVKDGSLVIGNMLLAAESLGLGACWINRAEAYETAEGKALLQKWGVEGSYIGVGHCILGYAEGDKKTASARKKDYVVRV